MHLDRLAAPRVFPVGRRALTISHVLNVFLEANEMVTFIDSEGREYDVVAKEWGFYATPSVDRRLRDFGLRAAFVRNQGDGRGFVVLVALTMLEEWEAYMNSEGQVLVTWLDQLE